MLITQLQWSDFFYVECRVGL